MKGTIKNELWNMDILQTRMRAACLSLVGGGASFAHSEVNFGPKSVKKACVSYNMSVFYV